MDGHFTLVFFLNLVLSWSVGMMCMCHFSMGEKQ
jgi:hypothetical protein